MIRLAPALIAVALAAGPLLVSAERPVLAAGLAGLLLALGGIAAGWRWPVTAAACAFLFEYALALWVASAPTLAVGAASFGLALVLLVQSADLAQRARRAAVDGGVVWAQLGLWTGMTAGTLAAALIAVAAAAGLASVLPVAATPFLAAAGALGVMIGLAVVVAGAARRRARPPDALRGRRGPALG